MATPVTTIASGGLPVTEVSGRGLPVSEALRGLPVTKVAARGLPVTYVSATALLSASPDITLSNGGLTVTKTAGQDTASTVLFGSTGGRAKVYAEAFTRIMVLAGDSLVGIAPPNHPIATELGATVNSWGWYPHGGGQVWTNNAPLATPLPPVYAASQWLGFAVDRTAKTVQFRNVTAVGAWSATFTLVPAGTADFCLGASFFDVGDSFTFNFDGTLLGTPPAAGYTRWGGGTL
jgi:hypothetical protein